MNRKRQNQQGSILLEGCVSLSIVVFIVVLQIELIRRVWTGTVLQLLAFETVRERVLELESTLVQFETGLLFSLVSDWTMQPSGFPNLIEKEENITSKGEAINRLHLKYSSLLRLSEYGGLKKFNYEVTEQCRFPYSSH